jgi:chemotaxis protein CheD
MHIYHEDERIKTLNVTIGIADMKVSGDPEVTLVTHSLGSCIGVAVYDPVVKVGGILHYMLPDSEIDTEKAASNPLMFADTAIPLLFKACYKLGAKKTRMVVKVAGGSQIMDESRVFDIGKRNYTALRKVFWRNNVMIDAEDVGGSSNRTIRLNIATGQLSIRVSGIGERTL